MHGHKNVYRSYDTWKFAFLSYLFLFFFGGGVGGVVHHYIWYCGITYILNNF